MTKELKQRIALAVAHRFEDLKTDKSLLIKLHGEAFFSQLCPTCENAQIQAYIELFRLINPKQMPTPNPPSTKYRFNPKHEDAIVSIPAMRWTITADTLTDAQAELMLKMGHWDANNLIVTVEESELIRTAPIEPIKKVRKPRK
jgi:hypothetical protein